MAGDSTLIVTTRAGVRPLGVRGEPLHNAAPQLRSAIRRRLGDPMADLLAEPQLHEDGKTIDWYAGWSGAVRKVADLPPPERATILADVDRALTKIAELGGTLEQAGRGEESGLIGRSLRLAAKKPAESFVFLVGERPVVVCWGYEKEAAASLIGPALPKVPERRSVLDAPAPLPATNLPMLAAPRGIPWFRTLLVALPLLLLLLGGAWLLRELLPADPQTALATREGPPAPPAPLPPPKEPPKEAPKPPPQVATIAPPPKPAPPPPVPQPQRPSDGRMRLPAGPTNDFSFMKGCWRTDPFKHERTQMQPGVSSYCFDAYGNGSLEWRRGRTACRTRARAQFNGSDLALRDSDTTCNDGSRWYADQLVCRRGSDNVADCYGRSHGASGPVSWIVNLHKVN